MGILEWNLPQPPLTAAPTTVPPVSPPSPPLTFLADGAVGSDLVYLVALAAAAAVVAILSFRTTGTASRGNRDAHLASKPPPPPTLFELLNLDPSAPSSCSLYDDDAVRLAVQADPSAAKEKHRFPLGHGLKSAPIHPLSMACCLGASIRTVRALYDAHPDAIAHHDRQKRYAPIHWAVRYAYTKESRVDPEVLRLLANVYAHSGKSGPKNPLRMAVLHDAGPDAVKILIDLWPDDRRARGRDVDRRTALHLAAERGQAASVEVCGALLDAFPDTIAARDREKRTPLHAALKYGAGDDVVALFIEAAVNHGGNNGGGPQEVVGMSDREGNTPLHAACAARASLGVLQSLLEVDPSLVARTNERGEVPLSLLRNALTKREQRAALPFADELGPERATLPYADELGDEDEAFGEEASALRERIRLLLQASYEETVDDDAICCICWDPLRSSERLVEGLFCGHFFHAGCIQEWLQTCILNGTERQCPLCRGSTRGEAAGRGV